MAGNKMTIPAIKKLFRTIEAPVVVATGRPLALTDHGKVLDVTAALTVTIPQDTLPPGFRCQFIAPSGVNLSVDPLGTVTLNGATTTLTRARAGNASLIEFVVRANNVCLLGGA